MSFTVTEPSSHQSENTWFTPKSFIDLLGPFDLDPCTVSYRPFDTAKFCVEYAKGNDGLDVEWSGDVWLNPPYGKEINPFVDKFIKHKKGVMLIFARMGSEQVQKIAKQHAFFYMLRKRIHFIKKDFTKATNAGTDSMLVFWDLKYIEKCKQLDGVLMAHLDIERFSNFIKSKRV